jgi:penicillin-binding protein 1C
MQVARLLEPREERSLSAKVRQIAIYLESRLAKREILDLYLELAPYGGNLEGVRAASLAYFGKEPRRLSLGEAALLVALPQSPEMRRPDRDADAARAARDRVLDRAVANNTLTLAEATLANTEPVPQARLAFPTLAPHAAEAALRLAPESRIHKLAIDAKWQQTLETLARDSVQRIGAKVSAAILVIDNASGEVRAHVGAADYFSAERGGGIDMIEALRSPGSALKPFIYALAFENGIAHPETMLDDRPSCWGVWQPENFDLAYRGSVTARRALQMSLNVPAIELLDQIGPARFLARLRNAGAEIALSDDSAPGLAVGLGGLGIKLGDLARLYVGLARGGDAPPLIEEVGATPKTAARPIAEPLAAWYVGDTCAAHRRRSTRQADASRTRPAPLTAIAMRSRSATIAATRSRSGLDGRTTRPFRALSDGLSRRRSCSTRSRGSASIPSFHRSRAKRLSHAPPRCRRRCGFCARMRRKCSRRRTARRCASRFRRTARVDLGLSRRDASSLALKAQGGVPPLIWIVNGAPLGAPDLRRQANWTADGAGFARVSVIDAKARRIRSQYGWNDCSQTLKFLPSIVTKLYAFSAPHGLSCGDRLGE